MGGRASPSRPKIGGKGWGEKLGDPVLDDPPSFGEGDDRGSFATRESAPSPHPDLHFVPSDVASPDSFRGPKLITTDCSDGRTIIHSRVASSELERLSVPPKLERRVDWNQILAEGLYPLQWILEVHRGLAVSYL